MPATTSKKIVAQGMCNVLTVKLAESGTAYASDPVKWQGTTQLVFTPTRTVTDLASGNDPSYLTVQGLVTGTVELTLFDISVDDLAKLVCAKYSATDGLMVGDFDDPITYVGLSVDKLVRTKEASAETVSYTKTILYKVRFDLPALDIRTISEEDNSISEIKLTGKAFPVFFAKTNGEGARTYTIVNSVTNSTKYNANKDTIIYPTAAAAS